MALTRATAVSGADSCENTSSWCYSELTRPYNQCHITLGWWSNVSIWVKAQGSIESKKTNQCLTSASVDSDKHSGLTVTAAQHTALMKIQSSRQADHTLNQIKPNPLTFPSTVTGYHTVPHCPLLQTATESVWCFRKLYDNSKILQNNFRWLQKYDIFTEHVIGNHNNRDNSTTSVIFQMSKNALHIRDHLSKYSWIIHSLAINFFDFTTNIIKDDRKGFVLFKINSSPSAFYIIKPTCISWLVFEVNKCLKNCRKAHTQTFVYVG